MQRVRFPNAERRLAAYYWELWRAGDWAADEEDRAGVLESLADHLEAANMDAALLYRLVSPARLQAWETWTGSFEGFVREDIGRAWRRAEADHTAAGLAAQVRCALTVATLTSWAGVLPPVLFSPAVQLGALRPERAVALLRRLPPDSPQFAFIARGLAPLLPYQLLASVAELAASAPLEQPPLRAPRVELLAVVAPFLPAAEQLEHLRRALAAVAAIVNPQLKLGALTMLAPYLPTDLRQDALDLGLGVAGGWSRAYGLGQLAAALGGESGRRALADALATALAHPDFQERGQLFVALLPQAPETLLAPALELLGRLPGEEDRARLLAALAPYLQPSQIDAALVAAHGFAHEAWRVQALMSLASRVAEQGRAQLLAEGVQLAWRIAEPSSRAFALISCSAHLVGELRGTLLTAALAAIRQTSEEGFNTSLAANSNSLFNRSPRVSALHTALPYLAHDTDLMAQALAVAAELGNLRHRSHALALVAAHLPLAAQARRGAVLAALDAAERLPEQAPLRQSARVEALVRLAPLAADEPALLQELLRAAHAIKDPGYRVEALAGMALQLPPVAQPTVLYETLAAARSVADAAERAHLLAALLPALDRGERQGVQQAILQLLPNVPYEDERAGLLAGLAPALPPQLGEQARVAALELSGEPRVRALAALVPHTLPLPALFDAVREMARELDDYSAQRLLRTLAAHLPEPVWPEVLALIERDSAWLSATHPFNVLRLPREHQGLVFGAALRAMRDDDDEQAMLADLARRLPPRAAQALLAAMTQAARQIDDSEERSAALAQILPLLPQAMRKTALREAFAAADQLDNLEQRMAARIPLVALASAEEQPRQARELCTAIAALEPATQVALLADLAARVAEGVRPYLFARIGALAPTVEDAEAFLEALAPLAEVLAPPEQLALADLLTDALRQAADSWRQTLRPLAGQPPAWRPVLTAGALASRAASVARCAQSLPAQARAAVLGALLELAQAINHEQVYDRHTLLLEIAPYLDAATAGAALAVAASLGGEERRVQAVAALAPRLGHDDFAVAERLIHAISSPQTRTQGLIALAALAGGAEREQALGDLMRLIEQQDSRSKRLLLLRTVLPLLAPEQRAQQLAGMFAQEQPENGDQTRLVFDEAVLREMVPYLSEWAQIQPEQATSCWNTLLRDLSGQSRASLLRGLVALAPVALVLAGEQASQVAGSTVLTLIELDVL